VFIAFLFHQTSIIAIVPLLIFKMVKKNAEFKLWFITLISVIGTVNVKILMEVATKIPFFARYIYALNENYEYSINYLIMHVSLKLPLLFITFLFYKKLVKSNKKDVALIYYMIFDILMVFMSFFIRWIMRMEYYSLAVVPFLMSEITGTRRVVEKRDAVIINTVVVIAFIFRFIMLYGVYGYDDVIPYNYVIGQ